ncbi:flagellar assembly protein A [Clostridium septicum]|uniref:DUF342 domain-containing protein n=1 Tax=Clostridium septicum TaxID=1504 RepID=A0A9N7PJY2_CLOSE|nr:flagellar assembly protein A [Clostridium septicum]AYE33462.1 DUF342 domain-containing protein [Clostridium septicum]MDU1314781.1 flagellar assembly protein A [Clostridium septicum]QAS61633.1 DUF342 domain-containing protein [Clostridium septicum]UEC21929.1 FapA family protein [Clostridium septicum]USS00040.1 FapA family protein [Clostridium septicum]
MNTNLKETLDENVNGSIKIEKGEFIITNPKGNGEFAKLIPTNSGELYVNDKLITDSIEVKDTDKITFKGKKEEGNSVINITTNKSNTEAYLTIEYTPSFVYKLSDTDKRNFIQLETEKVEENIEQKVSSLDIIKALKEKGIVYGVDTENLKLVNDSYEVEKLIIARGLFPVHPEEDKLKIYFNKKNQKDLDSLKNIDYKNLNYVTSVKAGEILAEIIKGEEGKDGIDVFGKLLLKKPKNKLKYKVGDGCILKDNKIVASIDGRPNIKKNVITVEPIYVIEKDIDISTGNIEFAGAIEIKGKVTEGMKVKAEKGVFILKGIFSSEIEAKGDSSILGSIVNSKINVGSTDLLKETRITSLNELIESLNSIVENIKFLKEKKLVNNGGTDGLLIKTLIDTKYKMIVRQCISVISNTINDEEAQSRVVSLIKSKLIGLGPTKILNYMELNQIIDEALLEIEKLKCNLSLPVDLNIEYAQEANIEASGNICISGKGVFASNIKSLESVEFIQNNAICRGGHIKAKKVIKSKIIGSEAGFTTKLEVEAKGHIYADIAYQNTVFIVGNRKYVLDKPSKDIHAYLDKFGDIEIEKFVL